MKKKYPAIILGTILSLTVFTGCGVGQTGQPLQQTNSSSSNQQTNNSSTSRETELQAEVDALKKELDALKNENSKTTTDGAQTAENADSAQTGNDGATQNQSTQTQNTQDQNAQNTQSTPNTQNISGNGYAGYTPSVAISMEEAESIALARVPGATAQNIFIGLDLDDGWYVYEGDILYNRVEYEFEIDANTGNILKWEEERW